MFDLALIIPCYNEEQRICRTFISYFNYFSNNNFFQNKKIAIVLVSDGSQDKTAEIIKSFEAYSNEKIVVKTISYEENQGKGFAIQQGCLIINAENYGFVDADLSFRPELTTEAWKYLQEYDLVIGERHDDKVISGYSKIRNIISKLFCKIVNLFFSIPNIDTQCGFKFFKNKVAKEIISKIQQSRFSFDIEFIILSYQQGFKIKSLAINFEHQSGSSITWKDGVRYFLDIISISERLKINNPKYFFLKLFTISVFISFFVYGWVIFDGFLFSDDFTWLWHGQKVGNSVFNALTFRMSSFYSPVMNGFYSIMHTIFNYNPQPLFVIGILVHVLVSFLAGVLTWQLSRSKLVSLVVVVLTSFAGGAYEPLVWIGANMHSFVSLFIMSCLIFYYHYLESKKNIYLVFSFFLFLFALGTKESAVVIPAFFLMLSIYYKIEYKKFIFSKAIIFFWTIIIALAGLYSYQQYLWQKNSVWLQSGAWDINLISLRRIPLILFDNFIPIAFLRTHLTTVSAIFLWVLALVFLTGIIYKFRKLKLIWFGLFWLLISISPVIFFKSEFWWDPLSSRYNYLPRLGAVLIVATILNYLIIYNKSRYIINSFIYLIIGIVLAQIYFMTTVITTEYAYIYNTGRSLVSAMEQVKEFNPQKIFVRKGHPFPTNNAHIFGAVLIITNINESNIFFIEKNEIKTLDDQSVLLYWDNKQKKYVVEKGY